jgi:hypothetical protein
MLYLAGFLVAVIAGFLFTWLLDSTIPKSEFYPVKARSQQLE